MLDTQPIIFFPGYFIHAVKINLLEQGGYTGNLGYHSLPSEGKKYLHKFKNKFSL